MSQSIEIGPLQIGVQKTEVWIQFSDPSSTFLEIPPSFDEHLREVTEERKADFEGKSMHLDLGNLPAISSRQLGMILTIRDVMKPFGRIQLHNISGSVKHLLKLTGTDRFFDL